MSGRRPYGFLLAACAWAAFARAGGLVPATFTARTDSLGFIWDVNSYGAIARGTNRCFGNALILSVNGSQFSASRGTGSSSPSRGTLS